jgi:hypothetical protein
MPSMNSERSQKAVDVAQRYLRRERPLIALVVVLAWSVFVGTYLVTALLPAVLVAAILIIGVRLPIFQSNGTLRLRTSDDLDTVVDEFSGPLPPVLALQWGVADKVSTEGDTAIYSVSYLFGLRSADVTVHTKTDSIADCGYVIESEVTVDDQPWATYTSTVSSSGEHTVIDVTYASNRRFGLRRVPQQLIANRYRDEVLSVQGYIVVTRDAHFGI